MTKAMFRPAVLLVLIGCGGQAIDIGSNVEGGSGADSGMNDGSCLEERSPPTFDAGFRRSPADSAACSPIADLAVEAGPCVYCPDNNWHCPRSDLEPWVVPACPPEIQIGAECCPLGPWSCLDCKSGGSGVMYGCGLPGSTRNVWVAEAFDGMPTTPSCSP